MSVLKVTITASAPLVFSERRPDGQFRHSTPYVPGSVIRGALAQQLIDEGESTEGEDFGTLFKGTDPPLFRNAYPTFFDQDAGGKFLPSRTLPATAYSCKTESGFKLRRGHGVYDSLIDRLCCESLHVKIPYRRFCQHDSHRGLGERVENFTGFHVTTEKGRRDVDVPKQLTTRVALNRLRKVSEDGMLYSPLVIAEAEHAEDAHGNRTGGLIQTTFHGGVVAGEVARPIVERLLPALTHVGSGVARGFGRVRVEVNDDGATGDTAARVKKFEALVSTRWKLWEGLPREQEGPEHTPGNGTFFSVTLLSDAVLREDGWTLTARLAPSMLGKAGAGATLIRSYATAEQRGGWNTAWRLPKDTELVARMGSVYVYHTTKTSDDTEWLDALRSLELNGVGERRAEGFGQVLVCDDFHQVIQEVG